MTSIHYDRFGRPHVRHRMPISAPSIPETPQHESSDTDFHSKSWDANGRVYIVMACGTPPFVHCGTTDTFLDSFKVNDNGATIADSKDLSELKGSNSASNGQSSSSAVELSAPQQPFTGTFHGTVEEGGAPLVTRPIETIITRRPDGSLFGDYRIQEVTGETLAGGLVQRGPIQDQTVVFTWTDSNGTGTLTAKFNPEGSEFKGMWDSDKEKEAIQKYGAMVIERHWDGHR
jgi:hypothetical protein